MGPQIERSAQSSTRLAPHRRYFPIPRESRGTGRAPWLKRLYDGDPAHCARSLRKFLAIYAHLGILMLVFQQYRIEGRGFQLIAQVAFFSLPVHYLLPYAWKKPFFLAVSLAGLGWVGGELSTVGAGRRVEHSPPAGRPRLRHALTGSAAGSGRRSISRQRGSTAGNMVTAK